VDDDIVDESSLIVNVEGKGLVIVVGCCHAGIENIVNYSKEIANIKNIYGIVGGLHLLRSSTDRVDDVVSFISGQNVKALMPMHCTGVTAEAKLKERLPNIYHVGGVGARLRV
jgi:7,8-dihydropterin-6-yl-methyl-4-(beta-D-ribofuranosyl)aminobenzene 5'-phosphate synthase